MGECRDCAYSDRPTYKWPCSVCRVTKNGRSMNCPEEADHIANDDRETDYVSRQWLLTEYDKRHKGPSGGARKMIEEAPAADVRTVVLCRDCRFYSNGWCYNPNTFDDEKTRGNTTPEWFCADGRRRGTNTKEEKQ